VSGRDEQRKPGTARGSPRRSRTARALRISRRAVKSRCVREWDGWGRPSVDGPGENNLDPSEGRWGGGFVTHQAVRYRVADPAQYGKIGVATRCAKGGSKPDNWRRMLGAGLRKACSPRWAIVLVPAENPRLRSRPRLGWCWLACRKAKDFELRITRLLASHVREYGPAEGMPAWPTWRRARCARSPPRKRSSSTKCVALPGTPRSGPCRKNGRRAAFIARSKSRRKPRRRPRSQTTRLRSSPAPHPRLIEARTQRPPRGRHGLLQPGYKAA